MSRENTRQQVVLLHSNDIHGDFAETVRDGIRTGGLPLLSGLLQEIRHSGEEMIYAIAGDMFMGSIIDREYRGLSTIKLTNALEPDVFEIGNHEVDYGLSHLLFLEKCAGFPVICANMYIKELNRRLFLPYADVVRAGIRFRFIGLLTESIADRIRQEELVDTAVSVRPAAAELAKVFEETAEDPADVTIVLSHLGIEEDKQLAEVLDPAWNVSFIIGGHSHTFLREPVVVNGIPIVQAGTGSGQIGRFDLTFDKRHRLSDWTWQLMSVNEQTSVEDPLMTFYHDRFQAETDRKYDQTLFTMPCEYTHPGFHRETQLGDLFADIYQAIFRTDIFFLSTNVIWAKRLGPAVTRRDLMLSFPYENEVFEMSMSGERLMRLIRHVYRKEAWEGANIFFLFSGAWKIRVRAEDKELLDVSFEDRAPVYDRTYTVGITGYAWKNRQLFLGIGEEEIGDSIRLRQLAANDREAMEQYFASCTQVILHREGRLTAQ
ncbi:MAG: metallophosphoesterase [Lachnospiraceae bacterium]|nr:metallophosphoesterase [Lachnospiraceae bacterium]